ncbi:hypothetical protein [Bacteriovorax sp. DB6_IX]|uniref:hypothetical protein n=1 Tax=Bacteriovorax sp. DB6_IX TaxID=1353530 RepID=UPI000389DF5D|nr:hypothetical protein [Bacteriovorax sp. DB6_IX]EQC50698.1 hypothetical protein M901_1696 [Bacteriovorax sp. DB6_IX]
MKSLLLVSLLSLSFAVSASNSKTHFNQINNYVDKDCPTWNFERFTNIQKYIFFGVQDAKKHGYSYGFPISREGVDDIWCALEVERGMVNKACSKDLYLNMDRPFAEMAGKAPFESEIEVSFYDREEQMNAYLAYVSKVAKRENIKRPNVGAVLEILSRYYLQELTNIYPKKDFTIGSGVEYTYAKGKRTIGELDIIVYDRVTCKVTALGESKASSSKNQRKSLQKARKQIARFKNFMKRNSK